MDDKQTYSENPSTEIIQPEVMTAVEKKSDLSAVSLREQKIKEHYQGGLTLSEKIRSEGLSVEELLQSLISEYCREVDNMAGNQILATENGLNESSSVISAKRVEMIDRLFKAMMTKKEFENTSSIDVDSPSMKVIWRYFMVKCQESFTKAGFKTEVSDIFFRTLTEVMADWRKDIKRLIAETKAS